MFFRFLGRRTLSQWARTRVSNKTWSTHGHLLKFVPLAFLSVVTSLHLLLDYGGGPRPLAGPSMLPTLATNGEVVFEESLTVRVFPRPFRRGELIVFTSPLDPSRVVCKRILGLPGDTICVDPTGEYADSTEHVVVPKGYLWVIGDNASMSYDSRHYGPLPSALVRGRLRARLYPFSTATLLRPDATVIAEV